MEQRKSECSLLARGQLRLRIKICQEILVVFVYEASHLKHPKLNVDPCSIFVKISVIPKDDNSIISQTKEVAGNNSITFNESLTYQILPGDSKKRLWITAWCKDNSNAQMDLIGCMSFGMKHLQVKTRKKPVEGWFCLLSESVGRRKHIKIPASNACIQDSAKEPMPDKSGTLCLPPVSHQLHSMMPVMIVMHKQPSGFGFTVKGSCPVCVGKVEPHSVAIAAGLASGDYIESVNGQNVSRLSAETVAAFIKSTERILILDVYRPNRWQKRYSRFEQDENLPNNTEVTMISRNRKTPAVERCQLLGNIRTRLSRKEVTWCHLGADETSSECMDTDPRMVKRRRLDSISTFRSRNESTTESAYNVFVQQKDQFEEVIYEEIDEVLPERYYQREEFMSCASEKCVSVKSASSTLPDSGVSSTAVSVASELDRGFLVPQHVMNNALLWTPSMSVISRTLAIFSPLRRIVSDSDCSFAKVGTGDSDCSQEMSNSNGISDRLGNKAFLSDTTNLNDERIIAMQASSLCVPSPEICDIVLHRFLSCEENFVSNVLSGVQRFSWPLRHCFLSRFQHSTLFQNIEKLMVLSEVNVKSLRSLCLCDNRRMIGGNESAIATLYTSKLKLMSQAYSQYLAGMTSSWQVLRELHKCQEVLTFIQEAGDESELTLETFLLQPLKHLQEMIVEFEFLSEHSYGSDAFQTITSAITELLKIPSTLTEVQQNLLSSLISRDEQISITPSDGIVKIEQEIRTSSNEHLKLNRSMTEFCS